MKKSKDLLRRQLHDVGENYETLKRQMGEYIEKDGEAIVFAKAKVVTDVRNFLFGLPGHGGHDLAALNIQRGRDHGLPDYNTVRDGLGLRKHSNFEEVSGNAEMRSKMNDAYGNISDCDVFVGGSVENNYRYDSMLGELFHKVIKGQFEKMRDGDRLWYENRLNGKQIGYINKVKLSDIMKRNMDLKKVPYDVFVVKGG